MSSKYRPLLPNTTLVSSSTEDASGSQPQSSLLGLIRIPRAGTRTACESCRKKKIRCNGVRPMCKRCIEITTDCIYRTDEEKKSILALEGRNSELMTELEHLRELYSMIHSRSMEEAQEIFNRIRTSSDPIEVLQMVKASELLLQGSLPEETGMEVQARRE
ncbi:uncharacterized protein BKA55DRAFT_583539 [Fusarium redolens]|uniref:Zn(2)-C6 fungal-type domain-containing protein n=1 Tax=Fusarium redolens TaxID=48865 RepID=A0A9P9FYN8_FUSRE|nr:uncharacterized protein BKA55DRAFT_583539 [Fusarium redolens]KAH7230155.1 hypothetical protein BKA55DRAFT_583539 [Fusarium redolens]